MNDKTEKASSYKLKKAKELGQISKSNELNSSLFLLSLLCLSTVFWPSFIEKIRALTTLLLKLSTRIPFQIDSLIQLQNHLLFNLLRWWFGLALICCLCVITVAIAQSGFVWSGKALKPDLKRLSLKKGLRRCFSERLYLEACKFCLKIALFFLILLNFFFHENQSLLRLFNYEPFENLALTSKLLFKLFLELSLGLFFIAIGDKWFSHRKFIKDQRMSKQEVKEEYRQREGDPKIKIKIKQLQARLRQKAISLAQVKKADVVVTNPNHLAIALIYEQHTMSAPKVVCKASDEMALQVKELARRHQVPIIENKALARALFTEVELNHCIQQAHFPIAAKIFREIYRSRSLC